MAIDDEAFLLRGFRPSCLDLVRRLHACGRMSGEEAERLFQLRCRVEVSGKASWVVAAFRIGDINDLGRNILEWKEDVGRATRHEWEVRWVQSFSYLERVAGAKRPEELDQDELFAPVWGEVNAHLGTNVHSMPELMEQLGILRFGKRPRVGDAFCGGGSIPFEAARMGCDVYASDLNPVACMLTWGALNIIGASNRDWATIEAKQAETSAAVDREIRELGIEHDREGNRAKSFLYCAEVRFPQTGWLVPLAPSWVISRTKNVIARLVPDRERRRFDIEVISGVSDEEVKEASKGTLQDGNVVYSLDDETYSVDYSEAIRGDQRLPEGKTINKLRPWEKADFAPRTDDILQERLYCIQWTKAETLEQGRPVTFFRGVDADDWARERKVEQLVLRNLDKWQSQGLVPDMQIESGDKTDEPIRTRGWTYWHHLFNPRQLNALRIFRARTRHSPAGAIGFGKIADYSSRLCRWDAGHAGSSPQAVGTFTNQALNTLSNYGCKSVHHLAVIFRDAIGSNVRVFGKATVVTRPAIEAEGCPLVITDPPYADAIQYHEITEFFIAWLRRDPPPPFDDWVWDSRRTLAIKGMGDDFRRNMIAAYGGISDRMPDNGRQIVMFTHQDAAVWADMASIVWGARLQVVGAWYIATETSSELKKGGYVQGTVVLVLKKRLEQDSAYRDELVQEVRAEVARQIETMTGLNQTTKGAGRSENLFEDQDLQMAGYAAALRVLTGYTKIDGQDMAAEALRPKQTGGSDTVKEIIDFAVQVANEYLVPEGVPPGLWERLLGPERFYLRMLDIESDGAKKLDNYQNFAKAFRYGDYTAVMASMKPNDARLKNALELKKAEFESEFGKSPLRAVLFALYELQREVDIDEALGHLRDLVPGYLSRREDLVALASIIAAKRETKIPAEAQAARILLTRIKNERLG